MNKNFINVKLIQGIGKTDLYIEQKNYFYEKRRNNFNRKRGSTSLHIFSHGITTFSVKKDFLHIMIIMITMMLHVFHV